MRALLVVIFCFCCNDLLFGDSPQVVAKPSDLKPPCELTDIDSVGLDYVNFTMTLADSDHHSLGISYGSKGLYFNNKIKSVSGDREEQILLAIIKHAFKKSDDPTLEKDSRFPYVPGKEGACFDQMTTEKAIKVLELRSIAKSE